MFQFRVDNPSRKRRVELRMLSKSGCTGLTKSGIRACLDLTYAADPAKRTEALKRLDAAHERDELLAIFAGSFGFLTEALSERPAALRRFLLRSQFATAAEVEGCSDRDGLKAVYLRLFLER
jgi:hypothetical protein